MRKWGITVTAFYALIVAGLLFPGAILLGGDNLSALKELNTWLGAAIPIGIIVFGQALLLFLSVDMSRKRLKPRTHILVSCVTTAFFLTLLTAAAIFSLVMVVGDLGTGPWDSAFKTLGLLGLLWLFWGVLFHWSARDSSSMITRAVSWLLKGSVLELLVAVTCHVIVRRRNECTAPIVTSFGIATGIAVMLLAFGPSVLVLYKNRLDQYSKRPS